MDVEVVVEDVETVTGETAAEDAVEKLTGKGSPVPVPIGMTGAVPVPIGPTGKTPVPVPTGIE